MTDYGWTSVPRSKKARKPQPLIAGTPLPSRDITIDDIRRDFEAKTQQWRSTECRKHFLKQLQWPVADTVGTAGIERYVIIGTGSLSRDNVACRRRSMWQLVVFLDLVHWMLDFYGLNIDGDGETKAGDNRDQLQGIWASDPAYTALDVDFLRTVGVEVLPVAAGERGLGKLTQHLAAERTLLFEPFVDMNAQMIQDMVDHDVALYIGSSIGGLREQQNEVGGLARTFAEDKTMKKFPSFEIDPNIFDGIGMYWTERDS